MKKMLSWFLTVVVTISSTMVVTGSAGLSGTALQTEEPAQSLENSGSGYWPETAGDLLSQEFEAKSEEQAESYGNLIISTEIQDAKALVDLKTIEECLLVVGIFDEQGVQMLTYSEAAIPAFTKRVELELDGDLIPEYFIARAFLVESESYNPLCEVYECPNYTREMQEFLSKTTDDFDSSKVLNFDDDTDTNYAVFGDQIIFLSQKDGSNHIVPSEENPVQYVIENYDSTVSSLQVGAIFTCQDDSGETLIIKVGGISLTPSGAVVTADNTSPEEVFDYVRFESGEEEGQIEVDTSSLADGVEYLGMTEGSADEGGDETPDGPSAGDGDEITGGPSAGKTDVITEHNGTVIITEDSGEVQFSTTHTFSYNLNEKSESGSGDYTQEISVSGSVVFTVQPSVKLYIHRNGKKYVEMKLDYGLSVSLSALGKVSSSIELAKLKYYPNPAVVISITPYFDYRMSGSLDIAGALSGTAGFRLSESRNGYSISNLSSRPNSTFSMKAKGSLYLEVRLVPSLRVCFGSIEIAEAHLSLSAGGEVLVVMDTSTESLLAEKGDIKHDCILCLDGELNIIADFDCGCRLFNSDKLSWSKPLYHGKAKLKDFYYCIARGEFGWGECLYKSYKTTIQVINDAGKPLSGATVTCETLRNDGSTYDMRQSVSGEDGSTFFYLKGGTYRIGARLGSYGSDSVDIYLNKKPQRVVLCLTRDGQKKPRPGGTAYNITGDPSFGGTKPENQHEEEDDPVYPPGIWKSVTMLNDNLIALIDRNDDLYTCFRTTYVPNNLNENTHGGFSTQLSLAMAGSEKTTDLSTPVKILSHVRELFSNDEGVVYAITQNGDLYTWGYRMGRGKIKINANGNYNPQEYYRESIQKCLRKTPYKLLSNVQTLGVMEGSGIALLTNGDVYGWGTNISHDHHFKWWFDIGPIRANRVGGEIK